MSWVTRIPILSKACGLSSRTTIRGSHHAVSAKYLQMYLDEICFRYNRRYDTHQPMFMAFLQQISKSDAQAIPVSRAESSGLPFEGQTQNQLA